ncbi:methylated-DNA--[protein]-cysteine S-methyltransferase [Pokkaliibacter sp. CJK22405]|uniref:methylated-DNA--[protein]-cysteine S-methyltransferase n=1 Tax=Pokkaliibacter sp. CJK22405 TaxID=3384615 RepID=UPI003984AAB6
MITTRVGLLRLEANESGLTRVTFVGTCQDAPVLSATQGSHRVLDQAEEELFAYFAGTLQYFRVPLAMTGTAFQLRVWEALRQIPYGHTCSYGDIAQALGKPGASRAVGMANNKNPLLIIVPCHRVIGQNGQLIGFGSGLPLKQQLLALEQPQGRLF